MKYLLDTHTFIWTILDSAKLSAKARKIIRAEEIYVSSISLWEISIKYGLGKLELDNTNPEQLLVAARSIDIKEITITADEAVSFYTLKLLHKDPFDRMLVWQCLKNNFTLLSKDERIQEYKAFGLNLIW
jgi:PIN domain nuclease of toxin-antitoxin system